MKLIFLLNLYFYFFVLNKISLINYLKIFFLCILSTHNIDDYFIQITQDEVAEWLRRQTANLLGSAREGSNPFLVEFFFQ